MPLFRILLHKEAEAAAVAVVQSADRHHPEAAHRACQEVEWAIPATDQLSDQVSHAPFKAITTGRRNVPFKGTTTVPFKTLTDRE